MSLIRLNTGGGDEEFASWIRNNSHITLDKIRNCKVDEMLLETKELHPTSLVKKYQ